jgi:TolA-binding protein
MFILASLCVLGLKADGAEPSEAYKAITAGIVAKKGDISELITVDEAAVQKIESLADQGQDVTDAVEYLESRVAFDPRKKELNESRLQNVRNRLGTAARRNRRRI